MIEDCKYNLKFLELEKQIFPEGSKITLSKSRVKQIRIRGIASQGMIIDPLDTNLKDLEEDQDVGVILGITKYEPPAPSWAASAYKGPQLRNKPKENPYFHTYNGLQNYKYYKYC